MTEGGKARMTEWGKSEDDRQKQKDKTLDPRLLMSRMTEGEKARMTEGGIGMKIANDNPKLSFLLPFSVIPALFLSFLLPFCHSCESRNPVLIFVACEKEKAKTLDPLLDWIPD